MKKLFQVGDLAQIKEPKSKNSAIIVGRAGKQVWVQHLEVDANCTYNFNPLTDEFTIKFKLKDGEFLAIKDLTGIAEKKVL